MFVLVSFLLYYFSQNKIDIFCIPLDDIIIINGERYNIANGCSFRMSNRNYEGQATVADHFEFEIESFNDLISLFEVKNGKVSISENETQFLFRNIKEFKENTENALEHITKYPENVSIL